MEQAKDQDASGDAMSCQVSMPGADSSSTPSIFSMFLTPVQQQSFIAASNALVKPAHSYIGLIAQAILSSPEKRLLLSELYDWILKHFPYFRYRGNGWRNSIRHNLSLNDCFVKIGRAPNGKSSYWTIHPANVEDFSRGDYRRKQAQWKVKNHDVQAFANNLTLQSALWPVFYQPGRIFGGSQAVLLAAAGAFQQSQKRGGFDVVSLLE